MQYISLSRALWKCRFYEAVIPGNHRSLAFLLHYGTVPPLFRRSLAVLSKIFSFLLHYGTVPPLLRRFLTVLSKFRLTFRLCGRKLPKSLENLPYCQRFSHFFCITARNINRFAARSTKQARRALAASSPQPALSGWPAFSPAALLSTVFASCVAFSNHQN